MRHSGESLTDLRNQTVSDLEFSRAEVFDAVKNLRRRYALYYLKQQGQPVELGALAEQVAAWENDTTVDRVTTEQRKSVYSALYQTHLPKLEEAGVINYDQTEGVVEFSERGESLDLYLANDPQMSIEWNKWYLGLSVAGLLGLVFIWLDVFPFGVSGLAWATLVLAAFALSALFHSYDMRRWRRRFDGTAPDFVLEFNRTER